MTDRFVLDAAIAAASLPLGDLPLCHIRLMDDRRYPWLVLVPRRAWLVELFDLAEADRHHLVDEAAAVTRAIVAPFGAPKANLATLGNKTRQFHLHVVVRRAGDAAWPDGIWNGTATIRYDPPARDAMVDAMRAALAGLI